MEKQTKFEGWCYEMLIKLIGVVGLFCLLFWWLPLAGSIGSFIRLEVKEGLLSALVCFLAIVWWKGTEQLYKKLGIETKEQVGIGIHK
ncbi:MAG: hypothetical protein WC777_04175 [Candidatus Gracilibacteria bacterium]|jgi:hypothetical protein